MAQFTQSIREIIYENKGNDDPMTIAGITNIAKRCIFGDELNVISTEYRDRLVSGFCLHYFNDEIGYETLPMWRFAMMEKMYNNAEFINLTFEYLDKQIFSDYKVTKRNTQGSKSDNISVVLDGSVATTDGGTVTNTKTGTQAEAHTGTKTDALTGTDANAHTGTVSREVTTEDSLEKGGTDTTTHTLDESHAKTGTETTAKTGTSALARTGKDTDQKTGTESTERDMSNTKVVDGTVVATGGDKITETNGNTRSETGSYADATSGTTNESVDANGVAIHFDTPMGALENLRTPNTSLRGEGVAAVASSPAATTPNRDYNYMSDATEDDSSRVTSGSNSSTTTRTYNGYQVSDSGSRSVDGLLSRKQTDDDTTTTDTGSDDSETTYNVKDEKSYASTDTRTDNLQDLVTHNTTETIDGENVDATAYGGTETREGSESSTDTFADTQTNTKNLENETTYADTVTRTDNLTDRQTIAKTGSVDTDNTTTTEGQTDTEEDVEETVANFNYEMYMKAEPMMSKLWTIFDDLFIMIIDAF